MWSLLLSVAMAQDDAYRAWEQAHDALLQESLQGDLQQARDRYTELLHEMPAGDMSLALVQYHLGQVLWTLADVPAAREVLDACIRGGVEKTRCLELRSRIDLEADAVHIVPTVWSFSDESHGLLLPHMFRDHGAIRIVSEDGRSELAWETHVTDDPAAWLIFGFREPTPAPRTVYVRLQSTVLDAMVELVLEDLDGNRYSTSGPDPRLPAGNWVELMVNISDLVPLEAGAPPLDPARLHRGYLRDATNRTEQRGRNELRIDALEIR